MARNEEKAQSMLNRFLRLKEGENKYSEKRPYLSSECDSLSDADKWRRQILREITKNIQDIQSPTLGEHKTRDLNDHINKLMREKHHWEKRIIELGGPNYINSAARVFDANGKEPLGDGLYKYYGEARNLPGVKELYDKPKQEKLKKSKVELSMPVDADYYGYGDDDYRLAEIEKPFEEEAINRCVEQWKLEQKEKYQIKGQRQPNRNNTKDTNEISDSMDIDSNINNSSSSSSGTKIFKSHVPLPSKEELNQIILEKKKEELRKKYIG
ncbi:ISY1-like protein [Tieghemostelium lacteum]|uniref:ISY1-like protein n=1 Tax=Tieghemostelium lacteum TaxID=361077 RepID=A0A151Z8S9_TIELA|nr:ISY1-like protein [Tieghemostelium lacteum]|eukprot:KYQ90331.1 ISY1-like protein [Tieghemostelium lacteum]